MSKDIFYNPRLEYEKNYYTEGKIENEIGDEQISPERDTNKENVIKSLLEEIENKFSFLPDEIKSAYLPPYYGMKDEYNRIVEEHNNIPPDPDPIPDPDPEDPDPKPDIEYPEPDPKPKDEDYPPLFDRDEDLYIDVIDPLADPVKIIKETYYVNFIDIYEDYLNKVKIATSNFIMTTLKAISINTIKGQLLNYSSKEIKNKNLLHLSDFLTKSDIILNQTMRLHKKLFQIDEIILHVRGIRIAKEQMIRYNSISEIDQKNFLDVDGNVILKESIRTAEKKYEEYLYALYKYLNSSVILLDESLKSVTKQNKAMIIINNNEERN